MPPRAERSAARLAAAAVALACVVLVAIPAYLSIAPARRPLALRLCGTAIVALAGVRVLRWARGAAGPAGLSALDAPPAPPAGVELDQHFLALRDDVRESRRSRRYFDAILWPRLSALAGAELPRPAARRGVLSRRGPSMRELAQIVALAEERR